MTKTVSVKEIRLKFGKIRQDLAKGINFIVIYRSRPICELKPLNNPISMEEQQRIFASWPTFSQPLSKSSVELIRQIRD